MNPPTVGERLAVLLSVARLADGAYGLAIRRDVSERAAHDYSVGAVYTTLQRLEDKRLLTSRRSEPLPVRGGRARRYFQLTAAGAQALDRARSLSTQLWSGFAPEPGTT